MIRHAPWIALSLALWVMTAAPAAAGQAPEGPTLRSSTTGALTPDEQAMPVPGPTIAAQNAVMKAEEAEQAGGPSLLAPGRSTVVVALGLIAGLFVALVVLRNRALPSAT